MNLSQENTRGYQDANDIRIQGEEMKGGEGYEVARKEGKIKKTKINS